MIGYLCTCLFGSSYCLLVGIILEEYIILTFVITLFSFNTICFLSQFLCFLVRFEQSQLAGNDDCLTQLCEGIKLYNCNKDDREKRCPGIDPKNIKLQNHWDFGGEV